MHEAIRCRSCGHVELIAGERCSTCGHRLADRAKPRVSVLAMLAAIVLLAAVVGVVAWAIPPINEAIGRVFKMVLARLGRV
jgi:uncharacterized paraquat-inducible protein A